MTAIKWTNDGPTHNLYIMGLYRGYVIEVSDGKVFGYLRIPRQEPVTKYAITGGDVESAKTALIAFMRNQKAMAALKSQLVEMLDIGGLLNYVDAEGRVHVITRTTHVGEPSETIRITPYATGFTTELMLGKDVELKTTGLDMDAVLRQVLATAF